MSLKSQRQEAIRRHLYKQGPTKIGKLAEAVQTSIATLRRDLTELEGRGVLDRVHGGARLAQGSTLEVAFESREGQNLEAKRAIADHSYGLIRPHSTCFFDSSTTILQLARRLRLEPFPVTVFTNGLSIAQALLGVPRVRVVLLGGQLRHENASVVGPEAQAMVERLWFDQVFLGVGAVTSDGWVFGVDMAEASLNAATFRRSAERHLLADSSKFGLVATYAVLRLGPETHVVTDAKLTPEWQNNLRLWGAPLTLS